MITAAVRLAKTEPFSDYRSFVDQLPVKKPSC